MRVYIAGPMTGLPDENRPAFYAAVRRFNAWGYQAILPPDMDAGPISHTNAGSSVHSHYMRHDLPMVAACDGIALLSGWANSKGARGEVAVALMCGLELFDGETGEKLLPALVSNILHASFIPELHLV